MKNAEAVLESKGGSAKRQELAARLRGRIIYLARKAGKVGLTINEAEAQINDHKGHSVSPRFSELVNQGALVRVPIGCGEPTRRFPKGIPHCIKRYDEQTKRDVTVHWAPQYAPSPEQNELDGKAKPVAEDDDSHGGREDA